MYGNKVRPRKNFDETCDFLEKKLNAKQLNSDLISESMRNFLMYNIKMYSKTHGIELNLDDLDIILYIIPKDGYGKKYYKENYTSTSITGYKDYIYIILVKQLEYYMECNCGVLFIDVAIERGISDYDVENQTIKYIEYLSRIEAKENNYYKNLFKKE